MIKQIPMKGGKNGCLYLFVLIILNLGVFLFLSLYVAQTWHEIKQILKRDPR